MTARLSLAIVNWNTRDLLRSCLASLRAAAQRVPLEIIVVDNASADGSVEQLKPEFPEVLWMANPANQGFAAATNQALRRAQGQVWGVLNPDTEVRPGALEMLLQELEAYSDISVVGPKLLNPDLSLQPSGRRFPNLGTLLGEALLPGSWKRSRFWTRKVYGRLDFTLRAEVDELSGACFLARREVFERVGLFDERFFLYYEEVDWFRRAAALGCKVRYQPAAEVIHRWGGASRQASETSVLHNARSAAYYWRKHHGRGGELALRLLTFKLAGLRLAGRAVMTVLGLKPWREFRAIGRLQLKLMAWALLNRIS
jgi:hypothetical protein